ncbi:MAG: flagellar filament capping protein FliD [Spirochaetaceae bacterium]|nr:flagellar filament capping protein FliD [Spirochaetaceae bacterium]
MAGISIPGVSDKYKTNDLVEALMAQERLPLEREQKTLDGYRVQQEAWRSVNNNMSSLRESARSLYSFDNPFNNKMASSTDENAVTADPGRDAAFESFKIDVINPATADRFLSAEIEKSTKVPQGTYKFTSGDKSITMNWKGGSLQDFVNSLNRRGGDTIKATLIGVSPGKQSLLIESLRTGQENKLLFEEDALDFFESIGMIQKVKPQPTNFGTKNSEIKESPASATDTKEQQGMPALSKSGVTISGNTIIVPPRGSFSIDVPSAVASDPNQRIEFAITESQVEDITTALNERVLSPQLPSAGGITFKGITVYNIQSDTTLPTNKEPQAPAEVLSPVENDSIVFLRMKDGTEKELPYSSSESTEDGGKKISVQISDYPNLDSIVIRNRNTGKELAVSTPESYNKNADLGYEPVNAASTAADAKIKYEGITITRPTNSIDDVVPNVTLNILNPTERTATIEIKPDTEAAKDALITFIGTYNKVMAEMNILTQNKPELISELEYLTDSEIEQYKEWLGMFQSDFTLTNGKSTMQSIMSTTYPVEENSTILMLAQLGISTSADSYSGYSAAKLKGYLEINEKELDQALETNLTEIKNIFGYDSDGDLVIDSGIAYQLDKKLQSFVQSGGILSTKISTLNTRIASSETKIERLETQLEAKEQDLKAKYSQMESTLNSLESQSNSITNAFNNNNNNNRGN